MTEPWTTAAYPMVEEADATGRVAAVYAEILEGLPLVPSLFKSLAVHPVALDLCWQQTQAGTSQDAFGDAVRTVVAAARDGVAPVPDEAARAALGRFVDPLARLTLVAVALRAALAGRLDGDAAVLPERMGPPPSVPRPQLAVPSTGHASDPVFAELRRAFDTPIVNSVWRVASGGGVLPAAWSHLREHVGGAAHRAATERVRRLADERIGALRWGQVASPGAFAHAGVPDALPGARAIVEAYALTLPRVLSAVATDA